MQLYQAKNRETKSACAIGDSRYNLLSSERKDTKQINREQIWWKSKMPNEWQYKARAARSSSWECCWPVSCSSFCQPAMPSIAIERRKPIQEKFQQPASQPPCLSNALIAIPSPFSLRAMRKAG